MHDLPTASAVTDTPTPSRPPVSWVCLITTTGEISLPGRTIEDARAATVAHLTRFYARRSDVRRIAVSPADAAERGISLYETGRTVAGCARSEEEAFTVYMQIGGLVPREAFRRWRQGFPRPADMCPLQDPLRPALSRLESPRQVPDREN